MQEIMKLHCGIDNCNTHYEYHNSEENIVAITAQWRNEESKGGDWDGLLPKKPKVGGIYELHISFALKIDLAQSFWVTYFKPYTTYEGIDSETGINAMLFCLCHKKSVIDIGNLAAKVEIEVLDIKEVTDDSISKVEVCKRTAFLDEEINSQYTSVENFENFSLISANYQGDCGWAYIIEKKNGKSRIVAENHWDFHRNVWLSVNEKLYEEQDKKYGIQHRIFQII